MRICYSTNKLLRQTAKQRESSLIAEQKFCRKNPIQGSYNLKPRGAFSQNIITNRFMMKTANFNTLNTIPDYANSMSEVIVKLKKAA